MRGFLAILLVNSSESDEFTNNMANPALVPPWFVDFYVLKAKPTLSSYTDISRCG